MPPCNIPGAGVDRQSMLRLPGHGDAGPGGGPCGDLYIRFRVTNLQYTVFASPGARYLVCSGQLLRPPPAADS